MKLYLSSYKMGDEPERLLSSSAANSRVAVIQNASDGNPDSEGRRRNLRREFEALSEVGLLPEQLDLREFFGKASYPPSVAGVTAANGSPRGLWNNKASVCYFWIRQSWV